MEIDYRSTEYLPNNRLNKEVWRELAMLNHDHSVVVRRLFMIAGFIMLIFLPHISNFLPVPVFFSVISILALSFMAGFTSFKFTVTVFLDAIFSIIATAVFEYYAVVAHSMSGTMVPLNIFFLANQTLAVIFFLASYQSVKTLRAIFLDA